MIGTLKEPFYETRLNGGFREDVQWWYQFAETFNGNKMLGRFAQVRSMHSDSSNWGLGATCGDDWLAAAFNKEDAQELEGLIGHYYVSLPEGIAALHINNKEIRAVVEGASRWAPQWWNSKIILIKDSIVVQAALNMGRSRSVDIMGMLRRMFWLAVKYNFTFTSTYINTSVNEVCDALSRLDKGESSNRIREVDKGRRMCCTHLFDWELSCLSRSGKTRGGAEGI